MGTHIPDISVPTSPSAPTAAAYRTVRANLLPSPTWHRLQMNHVDIKLPELPLASKAAVSVKVPVGVVCRESDTFEASGAGGSVLVAETGMGGEAEEWLNASSLRHLSISVPENFQAQTPLEVRIDAQDGAHAVVVIDLVAHARSAVQLVLHADSPQPGSGVVGTLVRIFAEEGAKVQMLQLQTLDTSWQHLDDVGIFAADDAEVNVEQMVLGGAESYVGLAADLSGYRASCSVDTRYLGSGTRILDFDYIIRQRGRKTHSELKASGVLTGASQKTLRGTIDLIHGCKGSVGREVENVLLTSEQVRNKTIPVILCGEDDVQGDHGATIGHVDPAQLEYMRSRGLSVDEVEGLFARSVFDHALARAHDAYSRTAVERLAASMLDCSETIEEGTEEWKR